MKKRIVTTILLCSVFGMAAAQNDVSNIRVEQHDTTLYITYDLKVKADIEAFVSFDNGATYKGPLKHVSGAVGKEILPEKNKIIKWNAANEIGYVDYQNAVIKIVALTENDKANSVITGRPSDDGVIINGVKWATRNVGAPGTFVDKPEDAGMFYLWNQKIGWSATSSEGGTTWDSHNISNYFWYSRFTTGKNNDPSPAGWRLPTREELLKLSDPKKVVSTWVTQNGVTGRKFTDKTTGNSIFLPAAGYRFYKGKLRGAGVNGSYWSSTANNVEGAYGLYFFNKSAGLSNYRYSWLSVRAVAED